MTEMPFVIQIEIVLSALDFSRNEAGNPVRS